MNKLFFFPQVAEQTIYFPKFAEQSFFSQKKHSLLPGIKWLCQKCLKVSHWLLVRMEVFTDTYIQFRTQKPSLGHIFFIN